MRKITGCPHMFTSYSSRPHYCTYVQVEKILASFPETLQTPGDFLLYSLLSSSFIWLDLQQRELLAGLQTLEEGLSDEHYYCLEKRLRRCSEAASIMLQQAEIAKFHLIYKQAEMSFSLHSDNFPILDNVLGALTKIMPLLQKKTRSEISPGKDELFALTAALNDKVMLFKNILEKLITDLEPKVSNSVINLNSLISEEVLLQPALDTLNKHHHKALTRNSPSMDELTFIISHQTFELWFPIVLMSIDEVIGELTSDKLNIVAAEMQIRKITSLFKLFSSMIRMPQTMTASDYLAFRSQLQGGSGAESIGFRLIEISLGLRDPLYLAKLHTMNLMTEELSARLCQPSLSDVYLNLLKKHEIISEGANDDAVAYAIASELRPTEAIDKHSEPIWLGESLIDLEQSIDLWRQYHLSMVRRMIGYRPSLGVGGHEPVKSGTHDASTDRPIDGVAHLIQTLRLRIFPYLWSARSKISEDALMAYRA